jgi:(p)ppGpp synthase/HD superfamily hydrolase
MARELARRKYRSEQQLEHPEEVRALVERAGADEDLQAAALLHDLVEDTDTSVDEIGEKLGPEVAGIVAVMTEDESIEDYVARKADHRKRAREAGREVALLFVADKLSNARRMRRAAKQPEAHKIGHYGATLEEMRAAYPHLPLLDELAAELEAIRADLERAPA